MLIAMILFQAASPAAAPAGQPDIELQARVRARSLTIQKRGDASLTIHTDPDGGDNLVEVQAPKANGRKTIRNVDITLRAEANIADPAQNRLALETTRPN